MDWFLLKLNNAAIKLGIIGSIYLFLYYNLYFKGKKADKKT